MKAEKTVMIERLLEKVNASPFMFVVDYAGLTVDKFEDLRKRLRGAGAEMHVYKNTLVKKAAERAGYPSEIGNALTGQSAVVTGAKDVCAAAKVTKTFADEFQKPQLKAGVLDGKYLDSAALNVLADLPPREALLAQLLRLFNEPAASLARVLKAKADKEAEPAAA